MATFRQKKGTNSAVRTLKRPVPDISVFESVIQSLILKNPLGCTSYMSGKKNHPPIEKVREMYTAKFVYEDKKGKRIGAGSETYNSVDGYHTGIAAVIFLRSPISLHGPSTNRSPIISQSPEAGRRSSPSASLRRSRRIRRNT